MDRLSPPILVVNFKAYHPYSFGRHAYELARSAERVARETGVSVAIAPPFTEIARLAEAVEIPVFSQHADPVEPGARTGYVPLEALREAGAVGTIVNHSEHRLKASDIAWLVGRARRLSLLTLVCADTPVVAAAVALMDPDMVAVEPPELIGTGIPVSKAKPQVVTSTVDLVRKHNPQVTILTGAGISSGEDVAAAIKLGTQGVLVASAIVKAADPYAKMLDMATQALKAWEKYG